MINPLNPKKNTDVIMRTIPIISEVLISSSIIFNDPIIKTIRPLAINPGIKAGPIKSSASMKKMVLIPKLINNPKTHIGSLNKCLPTFLPSGSLFITFFCKTIPRKVATPAIKANIIPSK